VTSNDWNWPSSPEEPDPDASTLAGLLGLLDAQQSLIISVGTGGPPIDSVNAKYERRRRVLDAALSRMGIDPPFPWDSLWDWYGFYSANLGTYAERRVNVRQRSKPAREAIEAAMAGVQIADPGSSLLPTWSALDQRVEGVVRELTHAESRDDLQDVGRRCREILIDAARILADPHLVPEGQETPQAGNAKAWLDLFLLAKAKGSSHRELRAFVPVAWDLAQKVTHGGIDRVDAYAAAQSTVLIVRTLQQLADS
jgi:hypothetical protein